MIEEADRTGYLGASGPLWKGGDVGVGTSGVDQRDT